MGTLSTGEIRRHAHHGGLVPAPLLRSHLSEVQRIAYEVFEDRWQESDFAYFLDHECKACWGVFKAGKLQSYFLGLLVQGELDVISIATDPKVQRQGLGRALLKFACSQPGVETVFLEVKVSNKVAISLYESEGFKLMGTRRKYYSGLEDALQMRLSSH